MWMVSYVETISVALHVNWRIRQCFNEKKHYVVFLLSSINRRMVFEKRFQLYLDDGKTATCRMRSCPWMRHALAKLYSTCIMLTLVFVYNHFWMEILASVELMSDPSPAIKMHWRFFFMQLSWYCISTILFHEIAWNIISYRKKARINCHLCAAHHLLSVKFMVTFFVLLFTCVFVFYGVRFLLVTCALVWFHFYFIFTAEAS